MTDNDRYKLTLDGFESRYDEILFDFTTAKGHKFFGRAVTREDSAWTVFLLDEEVGRICTFFDYDMGIGFNWTEYEMYAGVEWTFVAALKNLLCVHARKFGV